MDLIPDDQQQEIAGMAQSYLEKEMPVSRLHYPPGADAAAATQRAFAEMGWLSIALPEDRGGVGLSVVEEALIMREIGKVVGPTAPIAAILSAKLAADLGLADVRDSIAAGATGAALAIAEEPLSVSGSGVSGTARVYDIEDAATILVEAGDEALLLDRGETELKAVPWLDPTTAVARMDLSGFAVLGRAPAAPIRRNGALLTAAMLTGLSEGAVAMIQEYAGIRETFGRKIGAYQAVRHPIAEGAARSEHAKALVWFAALAMAEGRDDTDLQVRSAKVVAHRAATRNADINIQLHGAIGITAELAAHHFMKRALMLAPWFGGRKDNLDALLHAPLQTI